MLSNEKEIKKKNIIYYFSTLLKFVILFVSIRNVSYY